MAKIMTWLFGAYFFVSCAFLLCISALICLVTAPFDKNRRLVHLYSCWWGNLYPSSNPFWKMSFEGLDNIDPHKTYVLVSNHQSYMDIFLLYGLYKPFKWVSKEEIFSVPFVGQNMLLNQYVLIKRGDLKSIKEMMATCRQWLKRGASIMMFPEGTRSPDGEIKHFRDGAFRLAIDCDVPVIPIVVDGTHEIMPKGGKVLNFRGHMRVKVLPPVYPSDFDRSSGLMRTHVYEVMKRTLSEMRAGRAEPVKIS